MSEMSFDVLIVGAGAAGLMAAATAVKRGQKVALIDHNKVPGKKILISGGGRCNFTNLHEGPHFYQSNGKNFFKKPLASYRPKHFIELVKKHRVPFYEKTLGQLFCKKSSSNILELLLKECNLETGESVYKFFGQKNLSVSYVEGFYEVKNEHSLFRAQKLIIATGGLSLPSIGASDWGHRVAKQFGHTLVEPRPVLVPFTSLTITKLNLRGQSLKASVKVGKKVVSEDVLFTHKGLSGPAILKASLFWKAGDKVSINWIPEVIEDELKQSFFQSGTQATFGSLLKERLPKKCLEAFLKSIGLTPNRKVIETSKKERQKVLEMLFRYTFTPDGTEGFRKAEATAGGVETKEICPHTMESHLQKGLYFVGEVLDVTGQLGGHNFQWAWASGTVAGQSV
mgnify:CR=1 FL=1|tara:strand:+ start:3604 stop:4794 length:1191 start_codon:yes stop_codon:yes gene_type:complete